MANFVKLLHKLARDIHKQKRKYPFFKCDRRILDKSQATQCWICEKLFSEVEDPENSIDLDHCHYSGKFLGWAHEINWSDNDVEWDYENSGDFSDLQQRASPEWENSFVVPQPSPETNIQSSNTGQPPDPGFPAAELVNDADIESNDIVDFDASSDENSSPDNPFINFEAEEATVSEPDEPVFKTARRY